MKILSAKFENFRLLKDLEVNFSDNPEKKLTIIRGANDSGKTTMLKALQWALYGDESLPNRKNFRLSPLDAKDGDVQITVTVVFEVTKPPSRGEDESKVKYSITRTTLENPENLGVRKESTATLHEFITDKGVDLIDNPEQIINEELPSELREVFFIDGDRALNFTDAGTDQLKKRERVEKAIRSLLGVDMIEKSITHVERAKGKIHTRIKKSHAHDELGKITSKIEIIKEHISKEEKNQKIAREEISNFDKELKGLEEEISEHLKKGDQEKLKDDLENVKKDYESLQKEIANEEKNHSNLFRNNTLANDLLAESLQSVFNKLDELYDQKKIPSTTIPILEERLKKGICICGETLNSSDKAAKHRIQHVKELIKSSKKSDDFQKIITGLFYATRHQNDEGDAQQWQEQYKEISGKLIDLNEKNKTTSRRQDQIKREIDSLGNTDIAKLRDMQGNLQNLHKESIVKETAANTKLGRLKQEEEGLMEIQDKLLKQEDKNEIFRAELAVIEDVEGVFNGALKQIKGDELSKVSDEMNRLFLEMIGLDPDQESRAAIRSSEISQDYDILVYGGPNNSTLNPDVDLNGASRRALTLAFILALTKVSGVVAPNIIDTPLGMTSGQVRQSMLKTAIRESKQLILFLTHAEIKGCENIIDKESGVIFTLTNSGHYPTMLSNDPGVDGAEILLCPCDHKKICKICERCEEIVA